MCYHVSYRMCYFCVLLPVCYCSQHLQMLLHVLLSCATAYRYYLCCCRVLLHVLWCATATAVCYWRVLLLCATGVCYWRVLLPCATDHVLLVMCYYVCYCHVLLLRVLLVT